MKRTIFLAGAAAGSALAAASARNLAFAEDYPTRPITLIVPWGPGGGSDQVGRAVAKAMEPVIKVSIPVINVPGADGNNGMVKLVTGDADGYTMAVFIQDTFVGNMTSKVAASWKLSDIVPLGIMNQQPFAYYVNKNSPYKTWVDFEKAARTQQFRCAVDSFGSAQDVATKFFNAKGKLKMVEVPFPKPGERYAALLGNQVDIMCDADGNVRSYVASGQMRALTVFEDHRVPQLGKDVPTATELGYPVVLREWRSFAVKAGTDAAKEKFLADALYKTYHSAEFQDFLKSSWSEPDSYVPREKMEAFYAQQAANVKKLLAVAS
jgi:tripartite-type tricarboxylate transporter receptor subunit TctC